MSYSPSGTVSPAPKIRILLADDHLMVRECVRSLLAREPDFEVVAEATDGRMAVERCQAARPDVVLMDINMPSLSGIEATRQVKRDVPGLAVIGLSMDETGQALQAMRNAGSYACLRKDGPVELLYATIRQANFSTKTGMGPACAA